MCWSSAAAPGGHLDVIDTVPLDSLRDTLAPYGEGEVSLHVAKSIDVLGGLAPHDFVLLDGDHNWRHRSTASCA